MIKFLKSFLYFPPPKEFGADSNTALPIDELRQSDDQFTWQDYYRELKKNFPIKFFMLKTLPDYIKYNIYYAALRPIKDAIYYLKCHLIPSKRYHLLSLVQPKTNTNDDYTYGWIDADNQILLANMNIVVSFVEDEIGLDNFKKRLAWLHANIESAQSYENESKILDIYNWWKFSRKELLRREAKLIDSWHGTKDAKVKQNEWEIYSELKERIKKEEQDMLKLLIDVREYMWT